MILQRNNEDDLFDDTRCNVCTSNIAHVSSAPNDRNPGIPLSLLESCVDEDKINKQTVDDFNHLVRAISNHYIDKQLEGSFIHFGFSTYRN